MQRGERRGEGGSRFLTVVHGERARDSGQKSKQEKRGSDWIQGKAFSPRGQWDSGACRPTRLCYLCSWRISRPDWINCGQPGLPSLEILLLTSWGPLQLNRCMILWAYRFNHSSFKIILLDQLKRAIAFRLQMN